MPSLVRPIHRFITLLALLIALAVIAPAAGATDLTKDHRERCKDGGWQSLVRGEDRTAFANQGDCVSYADAGGVPIPASTAQPSVTGEAKLETIDGIQYFMVTTTGSGFQANQYLYVNVTYTGGSSANSVYAASDGTFETPSRAIRCHWTDADGVHARTTATIQVSDLDGGSLVASDTVALPCS